MESNAKIIEFSTSIVPKAYTGVPHISLFSAVNKVFHCSFLVLVRS